MPETTHTTDLSADLLDLRLIIESSSLTLEEKDIVITKIKNIENELNNIDETELPSSCC